MTLSDESFEATPTWRSVTALHRAGPGVSQRGLDVAEETPVAIHYNGIAHAVMMATPLDLEDFAVGFSVAEGVIGSLGDVKEISAAQRDDGIALEIALAPAALHRFLQHHRRRSLRGHTSCGICGLQDLTDLPPAAPSHVPRARLISHSALQRALDGLRALQPLSARTHGAHAAAWINLAGALVVVREDVGRHNALDKLVGAALRNSIDVASGLCLITSRCSFEMVQKAVAAGMPAVVAISAPTALAIRTAQAAGLTLLTLDRSCGYLIYAAPQDAAPAI
jgi:FdhD protein